MQQRQLKSKNTPEINKSNGKLLLFFMLQMI
jgi:hypothetical protein